MNQRKLARLQHSAMDIVRKQRHLNFSLPRGYGYVARHEKWQRLQTRLAQADRRLAVLIGVEIELKET